MKLTFQRKVSERQQVVAIILAVGALLFLLWFFLLLPMNRQRARMEKDIDGMASELAQKNYLLGEDALQRRLDDETARNQALNKEWQMTVEAIDALTPRDDTTTSSVAHIDFKVALFTVRQRLMHKARTSGISLPGDLGVDETILSNEDAFQRMLQLKVVEKLVDLALDLKIKTVRGLRPLPPVAWRTAGKEEYFREYPLELDLYGTQDNLYELLDVVMESGSVFALRGLRVEPAGKSRSDLLNIKAVMSALVFLKNPGELRTAPVERRVNRPRQPMGH